MLGQLKKPVISFFGISSIVLLSGCGGRIIEDTNALQKSGNAEDPQQNTVPTVVPTVAVEQDAQPSYQQSRSSFVCEILPYQTIDERVTIQSLTQIEEKSLQNQDLPMYYTASTDKGKVYIAGDLYQYFNPGETVNIRYSPCEAGNKVVVGIQRQGDPSGIFLNEDYGFSR